MPGTILLHCSNVGSRIEEMQGCEKAERREMGRAEGPVSSHCQ